MMNELMISVVTMGKGEGYYIPFVWQIVGAYFARMHRIITRIFVGVMGEPKLVATETRETW